MVILTIAVLMGFAVLLAWPSESAQRLHELNLPKDSASSASLMSALSSRFKREQHSAQVIDALASLEAELQSGQAPSAALVRAAGLPPAWPSALSAIRIGGDVAAALRNDASAAPVLGQLAACWEVAADTGSGLCQSVAVLAESARTQEELQGSLNAELAGPRATTRVLTLLPVLGILLGVAMGADPVGWLLGSPLGLLCAAGGLLLSVAGGLWSRAIVRRVERQW